MEARLEKELGDGGTTAPSDGEALAPDAAASYLACTSDLRGGGADMVTTSALVATAGRAGGARDVYLERTRADVVPHGQFLAAAHAVAD